MGRAPDEQAAAASRLVAVKAVSDALPAARQAARARRRRRAGRDVAGAPAPGTVWVDAALLDALRLQIGDALLLGDARLRIARIDRASSPTAAPAS